MWITQEVVLSDQLVFHCGANACSWEQLSGVVSIKLTREQISEPSARILFKYSHSFESLITLYSFHKGGKKTSLFDGLLHTRGRQATHDHDRIYGLLGLVQAPDLIPDYEIPLNTLYRNVLRHIIENERSLDILSLCMVGETTSHFELRERQHKWYMYVPHEKIQELRQRDILIDKNSRWTGAIYDPILMDEIPSAKYKRDDVVLSWIPSWVPYWPFIRHEVKLDTLVSNLENIFYCATGGSKPQVRFGGDVLVVRGIKISRVASTFGHLTQEHTQSSKFRFWTRYCSYEHEIRSSDRKQAPSQETWAYPYGGTPQGNLRAFQATIVLGRDENGRKDDTIGNPAWNYVFSLSDYIGDEVGLLPDRPIALSKDAEFIGNARRIIKRTLSEPRKGAELFFTSSGHMGIGHDSMRDGDVICLLLGARVPFVLRPFENPKDSQSNEQHFHLLGECCK